MAVTLIEFADGQCFVVVNGVRIAKRQNKRWVSIEPGWAVHMSKNMKTISIEYNGVEVH